MDWGIAARYVLIGAAIIVAVLLAVFVFDAIWAQIGFFAAAGVLALALYALKKWDDRSAARDRERLESGR